MKYVRICCNAAMIGTPWVATLVNVCAWMVGRFPRQAQDDIWGDGPDALVSGVLTTTAETR